MVLGGINANFACLRLNSWIYVPEVPLNASSLRRAASGGRSFQHPRQPVLWRARTVTRNARDRNAPFRMVAAAIVVRSRDAFVAWCAGGRTNEPGPHVKARHGGGPRGRPNFLKDRITHGNHDIHDP